MKKYKYGPLIYNTTADDDDSGNFYWNGMPPVGYDEMGIPIDPNGNQCLPFECPLHPNHSPTNFKYNEWLEDELPTWESFEEWFDDNFLIVSDKQCKKYIIRWIRNNRKSLPGFVKMTQGVTSLVEMMDRVWPQDEHK